MPLSLLLKDTIFIDKKDGLPPCGPYNASVSKNLTALVMADIDIDILDGYSMLHHIHNGEERYSILQVDFHPGNEFIAAFWNLKLKKETTIWNLSFTKSNCIY